MSDLDQGRIARILGSDRVVDLGTGRDVVITHEATSPPTTHTPGPLLTEPGNEVHLGLPMGGNGVFRVIWSEQTGRDVAYALPPPTRTDDEGEVHTEPLDEAAELVRRWNAHDDLLAACVEARDARETDDADTLVERRERLLAAIAKATAG